MRVLILTPCKIELEATLNYVKSKGQKVSREGEVYFSGDYLFALGGCGKVEYALKTQKYINQFPSIRRVYCAGAGGGIAPGVKIFDVVVAEKTIEHDYKEKFEPEPLPEFLGSEQILSGLIESDTVYRGTVASGDEDIVTNERAKELHGETSAHVVAWEGAGGARACRHLKRDFIEIRGVSDVADHNAPQDFISNVKFVMPRVLETIDQIESSL